MSQKEWEALLDRALQGNGLSENELQGITKRLAEGLAEASSEIGPSSRLLDRVFTAARNLITGPENRALLFRLQGVVEALCQATSAQQAHAFFSPGEACRGKIVELFNRVRHDVDICVFTITDNHIRDAILAARKRSVAIRIISDNEKLHDTGSDIRLLQERGIPVKIDMGRQHMHHKFAIFDGVTVVTGSYNWTVSAATRNHENIVVLADPSVAATFREEFERMWQVLPLYREHSPKLKKRRQTEGRDTQDWEQ